MRLFSVLLALTLSVSAGVLCAGPLEPTGSPAPTFKTLDEIEPRTEISAENTPGNATSVFRITQPGSYYLSGNVVGASGFNGIVVAADGVTLDLNGFRLEGQNASLSGINHEGTVLNVTVKNGAVFGWGNSGIDLGSPSRDILIENVHASNNGNTGGEQAGIRVGRSSVIRNSTATSNFGPGFQAGTRAVFESCTARSNGLDGFIVTGFGSVFRKCSAFGNSESGFSASTNAVIEGCVSVSNGKSGFLVSSSSLVKGNLARFNGSADKPGAGIEMIGGQNRIESNQCGGNHRGIRASAAGNLILNNSASNSTDSLNYSLVEGNRYGQIVDITAPGTAAATGNEANGTVTTVLPFANFAF